MTNDANNLNVSIVSSLEQSMLNGNQDQVQYSIDRIGQDEHIAGLFITDAFGSVRVASNSNLIGTKLDQSNPSCQTCHALQSANSKKSVVFKDSSGQRVLRSVTPIYNKTACYGCHDPSNRTNGVFFLDYSLAGYEKQLTSYKLKTVLWGGLALSALLALTILALNKLVINRIKHLIRRLQSISAGDFIDSPKTKGKDEFAILDYSVNQMSTSIQKSIQKISRHRDYLQNVINSVQDGLIVVNNKFEIVMVNETFLKFIDQNAKSVIGFPCFKVLGKDMCGSIHHREKCPSAKVFERGRLAHVTHSYKDRNISKVLDISASPLFNENGSVIQSIEIIRDVSEKKRIEKELVRSDKMALMGRLSTGVAHEINNPLASISTCTEGLLNSQELYQMSQPSINKWHLEYLKRIEKCVFRCKNIIERLLAFSHPSKTIKETFDLNMVIKDTVEMIDPRAEKEQIKISVSLSPSKALITGESIQISQLVLNLLINSLDAISDEGNILISTSEKNDLVYMHVNDDGIGIDEKHIDNIFEPFFTTKDVGKGTGLGLSICQRIVEEHGGSLKLDSIKGQGCKVNVTFPCAVS
jgi:two-component system, NtrC family, sensor kinase